MNVLLCVTGSVATIKIYELASNLSKFCNVSIATTKNAINFFESKQIDENIKIYTDEDEYSVWKSKGDPVLHIELRKWADILLIAPLSANTLAKIANGLCDNLVTCIVRAWDYNKPILVAPAMNTNMWTNVFTKKHIDIIRELGIKVIKPVSKLLACKDVGMGAMAEVTTIVNVVKLFCKINDNESILIEDWELKEI